MPDSNHSKVISAAHTDIPAMLPLPEPVFSIATQNEGPPVKEAKPDLQGDNNSIIRNR
jgi:hypothetical protein